jgi:hypothetical protein
MGKEVNMNQEENAEFCPVSSEEVIFEDAQTYLRLVGGENAKEVVNALVAKLKLLSKIVTDTSEIVSTIQVGDLAEDITYANLVTLIAASGLTTGKMYRITDYQTIHTIPQTSDRNDTNKTIPVEPILVTAISTTELSAIAFSELHPTDIIYYNIDNSGLGTAEHADSKGWITRRIDTVNNIDIYYDWRYCVFRRWNTSTLNTINGATDYIQLSENQGVGAESGQPVSNPIILTWEDSEDYEDYHTFNGLGTVDINNVVISENLHAVSSHPIGNLVFKSTTDNIRDVRIDIACDTTITGGAFDINAGQLTRSIICDSSLGKSGTIIGRGGNPVIDGLLIIGEISLSGAAVLEFSTYYPTTDNKLHLNTYGQQNQYIRMGHGNTATTSHAVEVLLENCGHLELLVDQEGYFRGLYTWSIHYNNWKNDDSSIDMTGLSNITGLRYDRFNGFSNIEAEIVAAANITMSTVRDDMDTIAGIWNLTGSGTVGISTIVPFTGVTRLHPANILREILLVPESGLTINIPTNNVTNGFVNSTTVSANGTNGEVIIIKPVGDRWLALS